MDRRKKDMVRPSRRASGAKEKERVRGNDGCVEEGKTMRGQKEKEGEQRRQF